MSLKFFLSYFDVNTNVILWCGSDEIGSYDSICDVPLDILNNYNVSDSWIYTEYVDCGNNHGYFDSFLGIDIFFLDD